MNARAAVEHKVPTRRQEPLPYILLVFMLFYYYLIQCNIYRSALKALRLAVDLCSAAVATADASILIQNK